MNYHLKLISVALLLMVFTLTGCSLMSFYPQPTRGFSPRLDYQVSYDKAWDSVLDVLADERVTTVSQVKERGRIITGYFTGASEGGDNQMKSRWSYTITFTQLNENRTNIAIVCKVEQYLKGWGFLYSWRDITDSPGVKGNVANGLEKWLYEKIEAKVEAKAMATSDTLSQAPSSSLPSVPSVAPTSTPVKQRVSKEYWSWGLGVAVKTQESTTITEVDNDGYSTARKYLMTGDEITRVGSQNIRNENAYEILTKEMPRDAYGLTSVVVRRDGKEIEYRIKPNTR